MGTQDRIVSGSTWVTWDGPQYLDPTEGKGGSFVDACMALTDAELVELCSCYEWRADGARRDIDRWWCWTVVRFGRAILASRRHEQGSRRQPT